MRIATEKDYVLDNGDSVIPITDDIHKLLADAVTACGESRPIRIKIMFDLEA